MLPKVTIMIPTFNQASFIHRAIESCLNQTYDNLEIIVSDDCSTDNTLEVINRYIDDKRIRYIRNSQNIGRVANYKNTLENYATGDWVVNLDGDDFFIDNSFIAIAIELIIQNDTSKVVFLLGGCAIKNISDLNSEGELHMPNINKEVEIIEGKEYLFKYFTYNHFSHSSIVYNRKVAVSIGFYRYDILSTDIESFLRLALYGKTIMVKKIFSVWTMHDANAGQNVKVEDGIKNLIISYSVYCELLHKGFSYKKSSEWRYKRLQNDIIGLGKWYYNKNDYHSLATSYKILRSNRELKSTIWFHAFYIKIILFYKMRSIYNKFDSDNFKYIKILLLISLFLGNKFIE